ncbi:MAG: hypothetical protein NZ693_05365 [Thermoflexales bacterium]|nr:hypothetical protein [Thermoflexales bacterium]
MKPLKGIYQHFSPDGMVTADERWQAVPLRAGGVQVDNETVRVAPFDEPRSDSMTVVLDARLQLVELTIHGLFARREARIRPSEDQPDKLIVCWRFRGEVNELVLPSGESTWFDWNTPLLTMVALWRLKLGVNQFYQLRIYALDAVTFQPQALTRTFHRLADEARETRFGAQTLAHYQAQDENGARTDIWCNADGLIFEQRTPTVSYILTAANL